MDLAPFDSPKLLLEGAKESIADFEAASDAFIQAPGYKIVRRIDAQARQQVISARFENGLPVKLRLAAYRCVNHLRDALDQAMCDAAQSLGLADVRNVHFPMGRDPKDLDRAIAHRLKGADPALITFVRRLDPRFGGNDELWALGRMAGPNKHQRVLAVGLTHEGFIIDAREPLYINFGSGTGGVIGSGVWNGARNEIEVARVALDGHYEAKITPRLLVTVGKVEVFEGKPAAATFHQLASVVEGVVLGLEAETARLLRERVG